MPLSGVIEQQILRHPSVQAEPEFLTLVEQAAQRALSGGYALPEGIVLTWLEDVLSLQDVSGRIARNPFCLDFVGGAFGYRRHSGIGKRQPLPRAVGLDRRPELRVVDATAGMGRDAFVLAACGASVQMYERHPVIALLLADALRRARACAQTADIAARMTLRVASAIDALAPGEVDVVYMDPMFPEREKAALVKKEMRLFRALAGPDDDIERLWAAARAAAPRVVVKRPVGSAVLGRPSHTIETPQIRFDVYQSF